jgi:thioredoxin 1
MRNSVKVLILAVLIACVIGVVTIKKYYDEKTAEIENTITNDSLVTNEIAEANGLPMLIDLGAGTCIPCKQMIPVLADVKEVYKDKAVVNVIDVNDYPEEASKYGIRVIPTQIFLNKDGKEFFRHEGFFSKEEIVEVFNKMGVK